MVSFCFFEGVVRNVQEDNNSWEHFRKVTKMFYKHFKGTLPCKCRIGSIMAAIFFSIAEDYLHKRCTEFLHTSPKVHPAYFSSQDVNAAMSSYFGVSSVKAGKKLRISL